MQLNISCQELLCRYIHHIVSRLDCAVVRTLIGLVWAMADRKHGLRSADGTTCHSKLNMVDLAGSERLVKTGTEGALAKEATYINKSLTFLEQVSACEPSCPAFILLPKVSLDPCTCTCTAWD